MLVCSTWYIENIWIYLDLGVQLSMEAWSGSYEAWKGETCRLFYMMNCYEILFGLALWFFWNPVELNRGYIEGRFVVSQTVIVTKYVWLVHRYNNDILYWVEVIVSLQRSMFGLVSWDG